MPGLSSTWVKKLKVFYTCAKVPKTSGQDAAENVTRVITFKTFKESFRRKRIKKCAKLHVCACIDFESVISRCIVEI